MRPIGSSPSLDHVAELLEPGAGGTAEFAAVRNAIKTTDGNASVHLRKLEEAGYVAAEKRFVARKPQTLYSLTAAGRQALRGYVAHLETLLANGRAS